MNSTSKSQQNGMIKLQQTHALECNANIKRNSPAMCSNMKICTVHKWIRIVGKRYKIYIN